MAYPFPQPPQGGQFGMQPPMNPMVPQPPMGPQQPMMDPMMMAQLMQMMQQPQMPPSYSLNVPIPEEPARKLINKCLTFKRAAIDHAVTKKQNMAECYAYFKGEFVGGDLLPSLDEIGNENDAQTQRPQIFNPMTRQQVKNLYSQLKMMFFPNDEDYFRVTAQNDFGGPYELHLTEGLKWIFKEAQISEKISPALLNAVWAGFTACYPCLEKDMEYEWSIDQSTGQYNMVSREGMPKPHVDTFNPLHFYPDPTAKTREKSRWVYVTRKKKQEILDRPDLYMNLEQLEGKGDTRGKMYQDHRGNHGLYTYNGLQSDFDDIETHLDYDLFYFPHIEIQGQVYRNMIVGIANEDTLIRFHPNLLPKGANPAVFTDWMPDVESPYGVGPVEDMKDIQRLINLLINYVIEAAARNGNRWAANGDVDMSSLFGVAGGVARVQGSADPSKAITPLSGNMDEIPMLLNLMGTAKAEGQIVSGAQNPFQGSSQIDFKKTATEMQILSENAMSILREVVEHLSITFVQPILQRLAMLVAEEYKEPIRIRVDEQLTGSRYITVDFSIMKQLDFTIEVTSVNMAQSKTAMANTLTRLIELASANPMIGMMLRDQGYHVIKMMADLEGIKQTDKLLYTPNEMLQKGVQGIVTNPAPGFPGVSAPQMGMGINPQPSMGGMAGPLPGNQQQTQLQ